MRKSNDDVAGVDVPACSAYAAGQLAKALLVTEQTEDAELAERAARRVTQWQEIVSNVLSGAARYGSRTPLPDTPAWATLEVATGGFATGRLLAGGPLEVYETQLIKRLSIPENEDARLRLNAYFVTDQGMGELLSWLDDRRYAIRYPEEGALLAIAWMCREGHAEMARDILSIISPLFPALRFYPVPGFRPHRYDAGVQVQDVATTRERLRRIAPNPAILAQRHAVAAYAPLHDRLLALFAQTMTHDDWPCQVCPPDWLDRARELLLAFEEVDQASRLPSKYRKAGSHHFQLRGYLQACVIGFGALPAKDLGRIRHIFRCSVAKRGHPLSAQNAQVRQLHRAEVSAPLHAEIAHLMEQRLTSFEQLDGLDDTGLCKIAVTEAEATPRVPAGTAIPRSVRRKIDRCLKDSIEELTRRGLISSGEVMAQVLPQVTSGMHGLGLEDESLQQLYAAIHRAFRQRRSLLLLNLESQVRLAELPWVNAIESFRRKDLSAAAASRQALQQIVILTLEYFPHAILPNKLVREIADLASRAGLAIPLVEELASDIFMGEFGSKFTRAAKLACGMLQGSLYADYYEIDAAQIESLQDSHAREPAPKRQVKAGFAQLCAQRAGVQLGQWHPASNGMIIEQQQILTTHNLAALISGLQLKNSLQSRFRDMAQSCFRWICARNQLQLVDWHAKLIRVKNSAYAWRQMVFFLSMLPPAELKLTLDWMEEHYKQQSEQFQLRYRPVLDGLTSCASARMSSAPLSMEKQGRQFLGWSETGHWLLRQAEDEGV